MTKENYILFSTPTFAGNGIEPLTVREIVRITFRKDIEYRPVIGSPTDQLRNGLAKMVLDNPEFTHLMMMDSDIVPPENIVDLLLACDSDLAAAPVPIMMHGYIVSNILIPTDKPGTYTFMTELVDADEPFEAAGAGTGCVLIRRKVFETVPWPWFRYEEKPDGSRGGEDIYFSLKAAQYGFRYKVHPKAICGHIKKMNLMDIVKFLSPEKQHEAQRKT